MSFFGFAANTAQSAQAMGNMDLLYLLSGRRLVNNGTSLGSPVAGRYGEEYLLMSNIFPRAGITSQGSTPQDDDYDSQTGYSTVDGGRPRVETMYDPQAGTSTNVVVPPYVHPLDLSGTGAGIVTTASGTEKRSLVTPPTLPNNPSVWPNYVSLYDDPLAAPLATLPGVPPYVFSYSETIHPSLMTMNHVGTIDEDNEQIASHHQRNRVSDNLFDPAEMLFLHASDADYQRANGRSRLDQLAPFNMRSARNASTIRKRLTTDSWDLNELTYVNLRQEDKNYDGNLDSCEDLDSDGQLDRGESSRWSTTSNQYFFPPLFGPLPLNSPQDPFRPELRELLETEVTGNTNNMGENRTQLRQRMNLNRLLVGFDANHNPIYRNLMPHPDIVGLEYQDPASSLPAITIPAMIHDHNANIRTIRRYRLVRAECGPAQGAGDSSR